MNEFTILCQQMSVSVEATERPEGCLSFLLGSDTNEWVVIYFMSHFSNPCSHLQLLI